MRLLRGGGGRPAGLLLLVVLAAVLVAPPLPPLQALRLASFDAYQALAPRQRASAPAVIVAIDDPSLARHGQWPWPRTVLARLVTRVAAADPAVIGLDILMPEPDRLSPGRLAQLVPDLGADVVERLSRARSNEAVLAEALGRTRTVLGAAGLDDADTTVPQRGRWAPMRVHGGDPMPFVRRFASALRSVEEIDRAALGHALLNADRERGVVRRVPLVAAVGDTLVAGFAAELLRVGTGQPALAVHVDGDGVRAIALGDLRVPTERDGTLRVHYSRHDTSRFVSAADVLAGTVPVERFARKIVIVGVTAVGLADYQATPVVDRMPGAEIHAQAIENIFDEALLVRPGWARWAEAAVFVVAGALVIWTVPRFARRWALLLFLGAVALAWVAGFLFYREARLLLDVVSPAIALGVLFGTMVGITLVEVDSQRRALREQLEREREAAARLAGELEAARRIQLGLLPRPADLAGNGNGYDLAAFLEPARAVGGDLYDFFEPRPHRLFFLLGDVAGKGLPGCLFMAVSKSLYRSTALRLSRDAALIMNEANQEITRDNAESLFVTIFAGILSVDTGALEYSNAGHEEPYVLRAGAPLGRLAAIGGPPLCVIDDFTYEAGSAQLVPGDVLCLMTDGVVEAMNAAGELYGRARLETVLNDLRGRPPEAVVEAIRADVARFAAGAEPADDLAILALRWNGPGGRAT